jgi:hypothetical protein
LKALGGCFCVNRAPLGLRRCHVLFEVADLCEVLVTSEE